MTEILSDRARRMADGIEGDVWPLPSEVAWLLRSLASQNDSLYADASRLRRQVQDGLCCRERADA